MLGAKGHTSVLAAGQPSIEASRQRGVLASQIFSARSKSSDHSRSIVLRLMLKLYRRRLPRVCHQPSMRAKRGSKPTAANVTRAIIIFRNVLILLGGRPLRDSFSSEIISTIGGAH